MDVHCTTCGEPWDVYHLRFDAIYETDLDTAEAKAWTEFSPKLKLQDRYREKFKAIGFKCGGSVLNVLHCPACPKQRSESTRTVRHRLVSAGAPIPLAGQRLVAR